MSRDPLAIRVANRVAKRPIFIDKAQIKHFVTHDLVPDFVRWAKRQPQDVPIGSKDKIVVANLSVDAPDGSTVQVLVMLRSRPSSTKGIPVFGGGFGTIGDRKLIVLEMNGAFTPAELTSDSKLEYLWNCTHPTCLPYGLYSILIHEITHAADSIFPSAGPSAQKVGPEIPSPEDVDVWKYTNHPAEVRAFMQEVVDQTERSAKIEAIRDRALTKSNPNQELVNMALRLSTTWALIEKNLSPANKAKILKAVHYNLDRQDLLLSTGQNVAARFLQAKTTPLPTSFPKTEIGMMTAEEFLQARNPGSKTHDSDSYDVDLFRMNHDSPEFIGASGSFGDEMRVERLSGGFRVMYQDEVVAVIHNGTAYYDKPHLKGRIPKSVFNRQDKNVELGITSFKHVKYLSEVVPLISPVAKRNEAAYPVILQRLIVKGEPMTVRAEKTPVVGKQITLVILNAAGLKVAQASDEWGATLLMVAQEYRGKGLGKIIGKFWYDLNPESQSGGFTQSGQENALALWRDRVHEFSSRGWYTALVREGRLTYDRVKEILAGIGQRPKQDRTPPPSEGVKPTGDVLVYADEGISFVVYDRAFLEEPDEKFIHGFGFFRDATPVGVFLYAIDYDRAFANMTTRVALQMARDNGEDLYDGEGYHDMLEVEGIPGVVRSGDYIKVTQDLIPLKALAQKEKRLRKAVDPYDEKYHALVEMAESKWQ